MSLSVVSSACAVRPTVTQISRPRQPSSRRAPRGLVVVRAEESQEGKETPRLSFKANDRAALGFTEADSAGQTNIFAVEPKSYVEGSSSDDGSNSQLFALGAFLVSATILAGAVTVLSDSSVDDNLATYKSLSEYRTQFAGELASAPSL
mmetsp:Transcript_3965/g.11216  ORF Transcript_3965/g.11216 Transcript_3965/m.11216 type:complete len:149 (+) Transcript_3965:125-571(+)|eukprot:CAMPEP_0117665274 /NCGR_PEP_ID=MMETSP0804-20121206/9721_1 /TAXON_ID=1074897 /ORGANISM="Tetraselmis astigmatica, Strain CCMP880" /LENGTH=148 /DNA_ID=CAMNT_0005472673 /DNA_START=83 /DNA_END=529 /DNA_ORIENTATION=+